MDNAYIYNKSILVGKKVMNPNYIAQEIEEYNYNPLIEALPPIFDDIDTAYALMSTVKVTEEEKYKRPNVRYHYINRIKNFYLPLDNHFRVEHILSSMIRRGYIARNPASNEFQQRLSLLSAIKDYTLKNASLKIDELCRIITSKFTDIPESGRSTAECASIIGISGEGKSSAVEKILLMYPQVIYHHMYNGNPLMITQIVWLKIDCPYDASPKTLCKMFFKAIDDVLGTKYYYKFGNTKNSTSTMMILMAHLASLYSIGILVVDEIQHIIHPKSNPDELLNFFVTLINTIGISCLFIGTPRIVKILNKGLRNARRFLESGCIYWYKKAKDDEEWEYLIDTMWKYQWLQNYTPLDTKLKDVIYYYTQGIIAIAVALFILAQKRAIFSGIEIMSAELLKETAENDMRPLQDLLSIIRNDIKGEIEDYEDIEIDINTLLENQHAKFINSKRINDSVSDARKRIRDKNENDLKLLITAELSALDIFTNMNEGRLTEIVQKVINDFGIKGDKRSITKTALSLALKEDKRISEKKTKRLSSKSIKKQNGDLRSLFEKAKKEKMHIYNILQEQGYIKDPLSDFELTGVNR